MSHIPYSSAVGSLMYTTVCTRPDLAYAASMMSRYMHNPGKDHWEAVKWILYYVKGSLDICLVFDKSKTATYDVAGFVTVEILIVGVLFLAIFSPCVWVQSHGSHHYSLLQLYPL